MKRCCECRESKPLTEFHRSEKHNGHAPRCKPCAIQVAGEWYRQNKDRKRAYDAAYRERRREECRLASQRYRQQRRDRKNADTSARRKRVQQATPAWANTFFIRQAYELAALRTKLLGVTWVVDHVIPLRGKDVCGLHVENNLQVIPETDNARKRNHYSLEHDGRK